MRARLLFLLFAALLSGGCDSCHPANDPPSSLDGGTGAAPSVSAAPRFAIPSASAAAWQNPAGLPPYTGPTGSVEGTIYVTGDRAPDAIGNDYKLCGDGAKTYGKWFREGEPGGDGKRWLGDAIVAITGYAGYVVPPKGGDAARLTIEGCAFDKRALTMTIGQRIEVKNLTLRDFWTPELEPGDRSIMRMATPRGDGVSLFPSKPGRYRVFDHDRKYAYVDVFVMLHPLHTTTAVGGGYRIDGVPVGKMTVNTSHPKFSSINASAEVEIEANVVKKVDLTLDYHAPPGQNLPDGGAPPLPPGAGGPGLQPYPGQK